NAMILALADLRDDIEDAKEGSLKDRLKKAQEGRQNWLNELFTANWMEMKTVPVEKISVKERMFGTMFNRADKKDK
ncbi:MAG: hypothetical protein Q8K73_05820, partial [Anaerolineales bacterium]|nr:hypothetical protein [Anaerolineales bacterium]